MSEVNKVVYGDETLIDLTSDTADEESVLEGYKFHSSDGTVKNGKVVVAEVIDNLESTSTTDALSANQGRVLNEAIPQVISTTQADYDAHKEEYDATNNFYKITDSGSLDADEVNYDNSTSGLSATDVQSGIDELASEKANKATTLSGYGITDAYTKTEVDTKESSLKSDITTLQGDVSDLQTEVGDASDLPTTTDSVTKNIKSIYGYIPLFGTSKGQGAIADALNVNTTSVMGSINKVGYVYSGYTGNLPSDCNVGIREVYYYNKNCIWVKITGISNIETKATEWFNYYNGTKWSEWIKSNNIRTILVGQTSIVGGNSTTVTTTFNISMFSNLMFMLCTGKVILASNVLDKNFFVSGFVQRVFWYDVSNLYYLDFTYLSDTSIKISATYPSSASLSAIVVGFN